MVMQRVAPAADASHELIGTSVVNRNATPASISEIGRVSRVLRGSSFCTTSQSSVRFDTLVSLIQEHNRQIEIRSRLLIEFEILHVCQSLGNSVNVLTAVL